MNTLESKDIFDRIPGYSNEMMYKQCMILHRVMFKMEDVKAGHGKKATIKKRFRYTSTSDDKSRKTIQKSLDHYKSLWNLEIIKNQ